MWLPEYVTLLVVTCSGLPCARASRSRPRRLVPPRPPPPPLEGVAGSWVPIGARFSPVRCWLRKRRWSPPALPSPALNFEVSEDRRRGAGVWGETAGRGVLICGEEDHRGAATAHRYACLLRGVRTPHRCTSPKIHRDLSFAAWQGRDSSWENSSASFLSDPLCLSSYPMGEFGDDEAHSSVQWWSYVSAIFLKKSLFDINKNVY